MSNRRITEVELGSNTIRLSSDDGVATVVLDVLAVRNALMVEVTAGAREALGSPPDAARCVVVRGSDEASAFCVGGGVGAMRELQADVMALSGVVGHVVRDTANCTHRAYECDLPTIATIDGPAIGAGAALAIACDPQLLHDDAAVSFGFRRAGLAVGSRVPCPLPRLAGRNVTMELVYTGEELGPDRAPELGATNHVVGADEFEAEFVTLTERAADGPTKALTVSKRLLRHPDDPIEVATEHEASVQAVIFETDDHAEGVASLIS